LHIVNDLFNQKSHLASFSSFLARILFIIINGDFYIYWKCELYHLWYVI